MEPDGGNSRVMTTVRDLIDRDLRDEPQSVVTVSDATTLRKDLEEYVLTDTLAGEFAKVLEPLVESARPATPGVINAGIWVSGFFGSGKSHFSKLVGHLLADTGVDGGSARSLFGAHLRSARPHDAEVAALLQEAETYRLAAVAVPFDISSEYAQADGTNIGRTFLRVLFRHVGLSAVVPFAEREIELREAGLFERFEALFQQRSGTAWRDARDRVSSSTDLAGCLAELLPGRFASQQLAHDGLKLEYDHQKSLSITDVVKRLLRWLDAEQSRSARSLRLIFVADEVGAWAGQNRDRIEQIRSFVETIGIAGQGRIWLLATSQERLSDVASNIPGQDPAEARALQHRLEARFKTNVHLESSEVGTVIEDRILKKKPTARPALEQLWQQYQAQLADIGNEPNVELGGNYPPVTMDAFVSTYPFLPYQLPMAADLFGGMRGPKVSSGARSMIKVAFDAVERLADEGMGRLVSWDQIFDSTNRDNEFADEMYLDSQGLTYLIDADKHVQGTPVSPSRVLKVLWLMQQSSRVPRTVSNLARMLVRDLSEDVLAAEGDVRTTLESLAAGNYVRLEPATDQWRFLTQDQVTVEKVVQRIADDEVKQRDLRDETFKLQAGLLQQMLTGKLAHGVSSTSFEYCLQTGENTLRNEGASVRVTVLRSGDPATEKVVEETKSRLDLPVVAWVIEEPLKLAERLRRALAIRRLQSDGELRRIATERTKVEVRELEAEADRLLQQASADVHAALESGVLFYGGRTVKLAGTGGRGKGGALTARAAVEAALADRIDAVFTRFSDGDRAFSGENAERLLLVPRGERQALDPDLGLFDGEGQLHADDPIIEALQKYLSATTKTSGAEVAARFAQAPYGWSQDLVRYAAAALFVEGRIRVVEASGVAHDDPRDATVRPHFGTAAFKKLRLVIEEEPLKPEERKLARTLLKDLDAAPTDDGEFALKEGVLVVTAKLAAAEAEAARASEVGLPLPEVFDGFAQLREELLGGNSRAKVIRGALEHATELRDAHRAMGALSEFIGHNGMAQFARSQELISLALSAGLGEHPEVGATITECAEQYEALKDQRRILADWDGPFADYRARAFAAMLSVYAPLYEEVAGAVAGARSSIETMPEFAALPADARLRVREEFLAEGLPLGELRVPELKDEQQLVGVARTTSVAHLRSVRAALSSQLSLARARVLELSEQLDASGQPPVVVWDPATALAGESLATEAEVDATLGRVGRELKAIVRAGKVVRIL